MRVDVKNLAQCQAQNSSGNLKILILMNSGLDDELNTLSNSLVLKALYSVWWDVNGVLIFK